MFRFFSRKIGYIFSKPRRGRGAALAEAAQREPEAFIAGSIRETGYESDESLVAVHGPDGIEVKLHKLNERLADCTDAVIREFKICGTKCAVVFIDGLAGSNQINSTIMKPMTDFELFNGGKIIGLEGEHVIDSVLSSSEVKKVSDIDEVIELCIIGDTGLMIDGYSDIIIVNTKGWEKRGVTEAQSESVVRGPREGFTETLRTNTALIRRRIKSANLKMKSLEVGRQTKTAVCLAYIEGVADPETVREVERRISLLDVDAILDSGYIEEYIEDDPLSLFPTIAYTEKPDVAAARILEGRVGIIVDGTPFVLTAPMLFIESFQSAEDYITRPLYSSLIRLMRYLSYFISVFAPGIYIALTTFHQEFIPTTLLFTISAAKEGTPFPGVVETLIMVFAFELLKEAGVRLPKAVGQAISTVGAIIMGEAAVSAGLVGAPMVITVAIMGVSGFAVPEQNESASILRLVAIAMAAFLGGYGLAICFIGILIHLATLESFGVPYFEGLNLSKDQQDIYLRYPLWMMVNRPADIARGNIVRRKFFVPPPASPDERPVKKAVVALQKWREKK